MKRLISCILMVLMLCAIPAGVALAVPAPPLTSVAVTGVGSVAENVTARNETIPTNVTHPATTLNHYKNEVRITVRQMGYGSFVAKLDDVRITNYTTQYVIDTYQGYPNVIVGYDYTFTVENVDTSDPFSIFEYSATSSTFPYTGMSCTVHIYWEDDGLTPPAPSLTLTPDYNAEVLSGFNDAVSYEYKTNASWTPFATASGKMDISGILSTSPVTLLIREAAQGGANASASLSVSLAAKPAAPTGFTYNAGTQTISNVDNTMEYRASGTTSWTAIPGTLIGRLE